MPLQDVDSIVAKLDGVLLCVSLIIVIFLCLLIFNRHNTLASLVPLASIVLGFSFIFGNSAATLFDSVRFPLDSAQPYADLLTAYIHIFYTCFRRRRPRNDRRSG